MRASAPSTAEDTRPKEQEFTRLPSVPFGRLSNGQPGKYTESHDPTAAGGNHLSPGRPDRWDPGLSRGGRRAAPTAQQGATEVSRREIVWPAPVPWGLGSNIGPADSEESPRDFHRGPG